MKAATIVGYHGYKNLGDDIFLNVNCRWLKENMDIEHCFVTAKKNSIATELSGLSLEPFIKPCRISRLQWISIFFKALRSKVLVFSAGSIFTIQPFFLMYLVLRVLKLLKGDVIQIIALGISIGPFYSDRDKYWCAKALGLMDSVQVRDSQSSELLSEMEYSGKLIQSYDLALGWKSPALAGAIKKPGLIGVAVTTRGFGICGDKHSALCEIIYEALDKSLEQNSNITIRIFAVCSDELDGDEAICQHIRDRLVRWEDRIEIVVYDGNHIEPILETIGECSLMISSRMHAGIMAILASVPTYQISYAEKIKNFFIHSEISTDYMYRDDQVTLDTLVGFIDKGLSGKLDEFVMEQRSILNEKGDRVNKELVQFAERCNLK